MTERHILMDVLRELVPVNLEGMQLLKRLHPAHGQVQHSINRETLRRATSEIIDYTQRTHHMQSRLFDLNPVPLDNIVIAEFGL